MESGQSEFFFFLTSQNPLVIYDDEKKYLIYMVITKIFQRCKGYSTNANAPCLLGMDRYLELRVR